jgi:hypothetical protein
MAGVHVRSIFGNENLMRNGNPTKLQLAKWRTVFCRDVFTNQPDQQWVKMKIGIVGPSIVIGKLT